ncbi:MAG TPA: alpha/beta hydrolase [Candidatus Lokiarchaeia archaeon]|nr:alpha/beta hydrolase [Candidatus Lokiarchaeia archaeon]
MATLRTYGKSPFKIVVVHGGPGAIGEVAPVARKLSTNRGVLEPMHTAMSVDGQIDELKEILEKNADLPATLIGHSWGAWLCFLVAAKYPDLVSKLILVASGPFEEKYARGIQKTRMSNLSDDQREEFESIVSILDDPFSKNKDESFARLGELISIADSYDRIPPTQEEIDDARKTRPSHAVYDAVWPQAAAMRHDGKLLQLGEDIECPVLAIHGDHDPHPGEGVRVPLSRIVKDFRFILLERCGHEPWMERQARKQFFQILETEFT